MKVLHLIDHLGPGGEQRILVDLLATRAEDLHAEAWTLGERALPEVVHDIEAAGVRVRRLGLTRLDPRGLPRLRDALASAAPDVLHLHLERSGTAGAAAALQLRRARPVLVASVVNDPQRRYPALHRIAGRLLAPHVDAHVAVSPSIARSLRRGYGQRARRIEVITPGLDLGRWRGPEFAASLVGDRSAALRGGARRVVGFVGRLAEQKAVHVLLEATPRLLAAEGATRILIVGDGPLRARLEERARALGIAHAVTFTGQLEDPRPAYGAMDVFVLPSLDEGFGLVTVEAMACGVPVVATRVVGTIDVVRDGENGLLVPPGDPAALATEVLRLLDDPDLARGLRRRAAEETYARDRRATSRAYESLYRELLGSRAAWLAGPRERRPAPAAAVSGAAASPERR